MLLFIIFILFVILYSFIIRPIAILTEIRRLFLWWIYIFRFILFRTYFIFSFSLIIIFIMAMSFLWRRCMLFYFIGRILFCCRNLIISTSVTMLWWRVFSFMSMVMMMFMILSWFYWSRARLLIIIISMCPMMVMLFWFILMPASRFIFRTIRRKFWFLY